MEVQCQHHVPNEITFLNTYNVKFNSTKQPFVSSLTENY